MKKNDNFNKSIPEIERIIGYTFRDKSLLVQAFTRTSYCNEHKGASGISMQSNEVLEFFGDGVLSVAIISLLLKDCADRYEYGIRTRLNEGDFSNIKSKLSDKKNLSETTLKLGLEKYLRVGEGDIKLGISNEPSVMEDLFESIVGAIYIDTDMNIRKVTEVVSGILDTAAYISATPPIQSAKNALQEWCADKKRRLAVPVYKTLSEEGPDHKKTFERGCYIGNRLVGRGVGKNQKLADAKAAEDALAQLIAEEKSAIISEEKNAAPSAQNPSKSADRQNKKQTNVGKTPVKSRAEKPKSNLHQKESQKSEITMSASVFSSKKPTRPPVSDAMALLKEYAVLHKAATPSFKDLGHTVGKGGTEYRIECRFMGVSAIGVSDTRLGARESAVGMIARELSIGTKKKSTTHKNRPQIRRK